MIRDAHPNELTQGTIFTCAASDEYPNAEVRGLIITARCDVAHGKAPIISYVPIVSFEDWLLHDGLRILAARLTASAVGAMRVALKEVDMNTSVLDTLPVGMISAHLNGRTEKAAKSAAKRFDEAAASLHSAEVILKNSSVRREAKKFVASQSKNYERLSLELLSNQISDFHYLDACEPDEKSIGHVVLLREIRYVPAELAASLRNGIDLSLFASLCREFSSFRDKLSITTEDHFAMPIGLLKSPYLELLMQRFTQLFARIGVTDFSQARLQEIKSVIPFAQE